MAEISVVVPVYNSEKYLGQCLDSLLSQTYDDLEIICVDDGSTDTSPEILKEYAARDRRIKIHTKANEGKGAASARNLGMDYAGGAYIQFLDSDDFFEQTMLERMHQKAVETDADIVICGADRYDEKESRITRGYTSINLSLAPNKDSFSWRDVPDILYQMADTVTWNKLYKKSLLDENHLRYEAIPISDDQYVPALGLLYAKRLAVVDQALVHYRFNTGSSQVDTYSRHRDSSYRAAYSIIDRMKQEGIYPEIKRSYLCTAVRLLRDYLDAMATFEDFDYLYNKYQDEVLPRFEAVGLPEGYFYDRRLDEWYQMVTHESIGEILFRVARAYSNETTRVLRG